MKKLTLKELAQEFEPVQDFPKPGILFWNANDLTQTPGALSLVTDSFAALCHVWEQKHGKTIDYVAGFDARGFIFGGTLAERLGIGFLQIRKAGKLPPPTVSVTYEKEYGTDELHMNRINLRGKNVILIDDLLATGGTAKAGCELIEKLDGTVAMFLTVTELPALGGRGKLMKYPVETLFVEIEQRLKTDVRFCVDAIVRDFTSKKVLLVKRLSNPVGYAMPGGGIETGESALTAIMRELKEETGCVVHWSNCNYTTTLVGADRDPRGDQVSVVFTIETRVTFPKGEDGKTEVHQFMPLEKVFPEVDAFAFADHHGALQSHVLSVSD